MKRLTLLALVVAPLVATAAQAVPARAFLATAAQTDNAEISVGNMAAQRGASPAARDFGQRLASDHGAHLQKVRTLADRMHIHLPGGVAPADAATARRLSQMRGPAFDRAFARAMVAGHEKAIAQFQAQARTGDRDTAALARDTLPTLREHLRMAQSLAH
jgi:putative membrane protein